jgi:acyl-CoA thioester hydrolase
MEARTIWAETEFTVEFYEVDSMEVVWHGNYVQYMEKARCALLNRIGCGYRVMKAEGYAFPVTGVSLKFIRPLFFGDRVRALAILDEYENCLRIKYEFYNAVTGELTTKGVSTQMAYNIEKRDSCFACPPFLTGRIGAMLAGNGGGA